MTVGGDAASAGFALVPDSGEEGLVKWGAREINRSRDYSAQVNSGAINRDNQIQNDISGVQTLVNQLQTLVNDLQTQGSAKTQAGSYYTSSIATGSYINQTIYFNPPFAGTPSVAANGGSGRITMAIISVSSGQCTLQAQNFSGGTSAACEINWVAIQRTQ